MIIWLVYLPQYNYTQVVEVATLFISICVGRDSGQMEVLMKGTPGFNEIALR